MNDPFEGYMDLDDLTQLPTQPFDVRCQGCQRHPTEISMYVMMAQDEEVTPEEYVIENEGTFNRLNGHFLCDMCYIKAGSPSSSSGWKCP